MEKRQTSLELKQKNLTSLIMSMKDQIQAALPQHVKADRIARIAITTIRQNKDLAACSEASFLGSLIVASQLGLEPNTPLGECYLIPYGTECTFQLGYKGLLTLAYNSGRYQTIFAEHVYPGDEFSCRLGPPSREIKHNRVFPEKGEPHIFYAYYKTKDGGEHFTVWSRERVIEHAKKYSKSFNSKHSPWRTSFDAMAKKTVILDLLRYAPKSVEIQRGISYENAVLNMEKDEDGILIHPQHALPEPSKTSLDNVLENMTETYDTEMDLTLAEEPLQ